MLVGATVPVTIEQKSSIGSLVRAQKNRCCLGLM